jgi:AraC-like DNA-binding protein
MRLAPDQGTIERIEAYFTGHAFDPHRHDTYALGLTVSGVQRFDYRGVEANSLTGNLIVIHPDEVHNGRAGARVGFCYRMAYVEPRLIRDALGGRATALPFARTAVLDDSRLRAALVPLLADLSRQLEPLEADQSIMAVAEALLGLDPSVQRRSRDADCGRAVEQARAFLDAHHDRVVASEELEAVTGLDRFECARQFRQRLGTSPYRYLTMRRLDRVRILIRSGAPLADVAMATGFADQSHMTRQFKRAYGLSPGRWREMLIER